MAKKAKAPKASKVEAAAKKVKVPASEKELNEMISKMQEEFAEKTNKLWVDFIKENGMPEKDQRKLVGLLEKYGADPVYDVIETYIKEATGDAEEEAEEPEEDDDEPEEGEIDAELDDDDGDLEDDDFEDDDEEEEVPAPKKKPGRPKKK